MPRRNDQFAAAGAGLGRKAAADARSFPFELDSVQAARHFVTGVLEPLADDALVGDAAIVATELAANAVLHARSAFTVTISASAAAVRIAVWDSTPLKSANGRDPFDVRQGHGLDVVSQLASGWATERLSNGKVVWAELDASHLPKLSLAGVSSAPGHREPGGFLTQTRYTLPVTSSPRRG